MSRSSVLRLFALVCLALLCLQTVSSFTGAVVDDSSSSSSSTADDSSSSSSTADDSSSSSSSSTADDSSSSSSSSTADSSSSSSGDSSSSSSSSTGADEPTYPPATIYTAQAYMRLSNTSSVFPSSATVTFRENSLNNVTITVSGQFPVGTYAIHVHQFGDISTSFPIITSVVGSHFNPGNVSHACWPATIRHMGDIGNLTVTQADIGGHGEATIKMERDLINMNPLLGSTIIGRSVIIHAFPDTCGLPTGNAGTYMMEGVIGIMAPGNNETQAAGTNINSENPALHAAVAVFLPISTLQPPYYTSMNGSAAFYINQVKYGNAVRLVGSFNGLPANTNFTLHIHQYIAVDTQKAADVGNATDIGSLILTDANGHVDFDLLRDDLDYNSLLGRSIVLHSRPDLGVGAPPPEGNPVFLYAVGVIGISNRTEPAVVDSSSSSSTGGSGDSSSSSSSSTADSSSSSSSSSSTGSNSTSSSSSSSSTGSNSTSSSSSSSSSTGNNGTSSSSSSSSSSSTGNNGTSSSSSSSSTADSSSSSSGSSSSSSGVGPTIPHWNGVATMRGAASGPLENVTGTVRFTQYDNSPNVTINIELKNIPLGTYGFHVHQFGDISSSFPILSTVIGSHFNPTNVPHACYPSPVRHMGDIGNLTVTDYEGTYYVNLERDLLNLIPERGETIIGRSVIIHTAPDNCGLPTGNAGPMLVQGVIGIPNAIPSYVGAYEPQLAASNLTTPILSAIAVMERTTDALPDVNGNITLAGTVAFYPPVLGTGAYNTTLLMRIEGNFTGLPANKTYAIHVHQWGIDELGGNGTLAGGHFNPYNLPHGLYPNVTRHAGDIGNVIMTDALGNAHFDITRDLLEFVGPASIIGRSLLLHAQVDDGTGATGNAGKRMAVGVIGVSNRTAPALPPPPPSSSSSSSSTGGVTGSSSSSSSSSTGSSSSSTASSSSSTASSSSSTASSSSSSSTGSSTGNNSTASSSSSSTGNNGTTSSSSSSSSTALSSSSSSSSTGDSSSSSSSGPVAPTEPAVEVIMRMNVPFATANTQEFKTNFSNSVADALAISRTRVVTTGVTQVAGSSSTASASSSSTGVNNNTVPTNGTSKPIFVIRGRRRLLQASGGVDIQFQILPSPDGTGPNVTESQKNLNAQFSNPASPLLTSPGIGSAIDTSVPLQQAQVARCPDGSYVTPCPDSGNGSTDDGGSSGLSTGAIVAIAVVCGIAFLVIVSLLVYKFVIQPKQTTKPKEEFDGLEMQYDKRSSGGVTGGPKSPTSQQALAPAVAEKNPKGPVSSDDNEADREFEGSQNFVNIHTGGYNVDRTPRQSVG